MRIQGYSILNMLACLALCFPAIVFAADDVNDRLQQLEQELADLKNKMPHNNRGAFQHSMNISGFGSFTLTEMSEDAVGPSGETNKLSLKPHSLMGLQLNADIAPGTEAVMQVVAEGVNNFDLDVDWLYINYAFNDALSVKVGRYVFAAFTESANAKVGYTYPTINPADEIYALTFIDNMDGLSVDYRFDIGYWHHNLNVIWGNHEATLYDGLVSFKVESLSGLALESEYKSWTLRLAAYTGSESEVTFTEFEQFGVSPITFTTDFLNVGAAYDDGNWLLQYEFGYLKTDSEDQIGDLSAHALLVAKRFDTLQPYLQFAKYDTQTDDTTGFFDRAQAGYIVGLRQEVRQNIAMKYQLKYVTDFKNSQGLFNFGAVDMDAVSAGVYNLSFDDIFIYEVGLQFVF